MQEFKVGIFMIHKSDELGYYMQYKSYSCDKELAELFNILYEEYIEIITKYNAKKDNNEYFFPKKSDTIKCAKFLSEKYGVILKLMGG